MANTPKLSGGKPLMTGGVPQVGESECECCAPCECTLCETAPKCMSVTFDEPFVSKNSYCCLCEDIPQTIIGHCTGATCEYYASFCNPLNPCVRCGIFSGVSVDAMTANPLIFHMRNSAGAAIEVEYDFTGSPAPFDCTWFDVPHEYSLSPTNRAALKTALGWERFCACSIPNGVTVTFGTTGECEYACINNTCMSEYSTRPECNDCRADNVINTAHYTSISFSLPEVLAQGTCGETCALYEGKYSLQQCSDYLVELDPPCSGDATYDSFNISANPTTGVLSFFLLAGSTPVSIAQYDFPPLPSTSPECIADDGDQVETATRSTPPNPAYDPCDWTWPDEIELLIKRRDYPSMLCASHTFYPEVRHGCVVNVPCSYELPDEITITDNLTYQDPSINDPFDLCAEAGNPCTGAGEDPNPWTSFPYNASDIKFTLPNFGDKERDPLLECSCQGFGGEYCTVDGVQCFTKRYSCACAEDDEQQIGTDRFETICFENFSFNNISDHTDFVISVDIVINRCSGMFCPPEPVATYATDPFNPCSVTTATMNLISVANSPLENKCFPSGLTMPATIQVDWTPPVSGPLTCGGDVFVLKKNERSCPSPSLGAQGVSGTSVCGYHYETLPRHDEFAFEGSPLGVRCNATSFIYPSVLIEADETNCRLIPSFPTRSCDGSDPDCSCEDYFSHSPSSSAPTGGDAECPICELLAPVTLTYVPDTSGNPDCDLDACMPTGGTVTISF